MTGESIVLISTITLVFIAAIIGSVTARKLRLPSVIGYLAVGFLFGNIIPHLTDSHELLLISDTGITLLLFTLGLEFSFHRLIKIIRTVLWAAGLQVAGCILFFYFIFQIFHFSFIASLFFAAAAALSSTTLIVKVLTEKSEMETVWGEIATGWLVIQDLAVVPIIIILSQVAVLSKLPVLTLGSTLFVLLSSIVKAALLLSVFFFLVKLLVPKVLNFLVSNVSREIFLVCVMSIVFVCAAGTFVAGFSAPLGAFLAGLVIAETNQNHAVFSEVRPLRDLFAVIFFVSLGMALPVWQLRFVWMNLIILSAIILLGKGIIVQVISQYLGYHKKTSFLVALSLLPTSEFAFILAREGLTLGVLSSSTYITIVATAFLTILISMPLVADGQKLYYWYQKSIWGKFPILGRRKQPVELSETEGFPIKDHVVICGFGRVGKYIGRAFDLAHIPYLVVEYNWNIVKALRDSGVSVVYGDPGDMSVLDYAQVDFAKVIIIAIPDYHTQELIIANTHTLNKNIKIFCRTHHEEDQKRLKSLGVHTIIQPEFEAAISIVQRLYGEFGVSTEQMAGKISRLKIEHGLG